MNASVHSFDAFRVDLGDRTPVDLRIRFLLEQHRSMTARAWAVEAKAALLLVGLAAAVAWVPPSPVWSAVPMTLAAMAPWAAAAGLLVAAFCAFAALFPHYPGRRARARFAATERWSWAALAGGTTTPEGYADWVAGADRADLEDAVAQANVAAARALLWKHRTLRAGFAAAALSMALSGALSAAPGIAYAS